MGNVFDEIVEPLEMNRTFHVPAEPIGAQIGSFILGLAASIQSNEGGIRQTCPHLVAGNDPVFLGPWSERPPFTLGGLDAHRPGLFQHRSGGTAAPGRPHSAGSHPLGNPA